MATDLQQRLTARFALLFLSEHAHEAIFDPLQRKTEQGCAKDSQNQDRHCLEFQSVNELIKLRVGHAPKMPLNPCQDRPLFGSVFRFPQLLNI